MNSLCNILNRSGFDSQYVHIDFEVVSNLTAGINQPGSAVENEINRMGVKDLPALANIGDIACCKNAADILFGYGPTGQIDTPSQSI